MTMDESFDLECQAKFHLYCRAYKAAKYHSEKRRYLDKIDAQLDLYHEWRDIQGL